MFALHDLRACASESVRRYDAATLSGDEAVSALKVLGEVRRLVDTMIATTARRVEATAAYKGRGDRSTAETTAKALGNPVHEARTIAEAGKAIDDNPTLAAAAHAGRVTPAQLALMGAALEHDPDAADELLRAAEDGMAALRDQCLAVRTRVEADDERRERRRRARSLSTYTDQDGMACGRWRLQPEIGARVKALIESGAEATLRERASAHDHEPIAAYAADAFVGLILGDDPADAASVDDEGTDATIAPSSAPQTSSETSPAPSPAPTGPPSDRARRRRSRRPRRAVAVNVHVVIDHAALVRGDVLPGERCEIPGVGPVSVAWVRDVLGDAFLTATIANGVDIHTVAHFGRHINAALRTALLVQGRECDIAGCGQRGYLEIDHRHDHAQRGPTALHNLGWLCAHHHRLKSGGWRLGPPDPVSSKRSLAPPAPARRAA